MYVHKVHFRVPRDRMSELRMMIQRDYFPVINSRPGFVAAYLMEQTDDEGLAEMVQLWETHGAAEAFMRTGSLANSLSHLARTLPGVQIMRQGYIVRASVDARDVVARA